MLGNLFKKKSTSPSEISFDENYREKLEFPKLEQMHPYNVVKFPPQGKEWQDIVRRVQLQRRKRENKKVKETMLGQVNKFVKI